MQLLIVKYYKSLPIITEIIKKKIKLVGNISLINLSKVNHIFN